MGPRAEKWRVAAICFALLVVPAAALAACSGKTQGDPFDCTNEIEHPEHLASTGLYSDWTDTTPRFVAWSVASTFVSSSTRRGAFETRTRSERTLVSCPRSRRRESELSFPRNRPRPRS